MNKLTRYGIHDYILERFVCCLENIKTECFLR